MPLDATNRIFFIKSTINHGNLTGIAIIVPIMIIKAKQN